MCILLLYVYLTLYSSPSFILPSWILYLLSFYVFLTWNIYNSLLPFILSSFALGIIPRTLFFFSLLYSMPGALSFVCWKEDSSLLGNLVTKNKPLPGMNSLGMKRAKAHPLHACLQPGSGLREQETVLVFIRDLKLEKNFQMRFWLAPKASFQDYSFKVHVAMLFYTHPHPFTELIV